MARLRNFKYWIRCSKCKKDMRTQRPDLRKIQCPNKQCGVLGKWIILEDRTKESLAPEITTVEQMSEQLEPQEVTEITQQETKEVTQQNQSPTVKEFNETQEDYSKHTQQHSYDRILLNVKIERIKSFSNEIITVLNGLDEFLEWIKKNFEDEKEIFLIEKKFARIGRENTARYYYDAFSKLLSGYENIKGKNNRIKDACINIEDTTEQIRREIEKTEE